MVNNRPRRSAKDLAERFGWEAEDITVRNPAGEIVDISKKPEEMEPTGKDVVPRSPEEK